MNDKTRKTMQVIAIFMLAFSFGCILGYISVTGFVTNYTNTCVTLLQECQYEFGRLYPLQQQDFMIPFNLSINYTEAINNGID